MPARTAARTTLEGYLYSPRARSLLYQAIFLIVFLAIVLFVFNTVRDNLARLGVASGFSFLGREGHFGIAQALIPYDDSSTYLRAFVVAVLNTLLVGMLSVVTATILGFLVGIMRVSTNPLYALLARVHVEVNRNIPLLLHILFWYYIVLTTLPVVRESFVFSGIVVNRRGMFVPWPALEGWAAVLLLVALAAFALAIVAALVMYARAGMDISARRKAFRRSLAALLLPLAAVALLLTTAQWDEPVLTGLTYRGGVRLLPELVALWLCLTLYHSAYIAEVVRAGIVSIDKVQYEAAESLLFSRSDMFRHIIIPQAARVIVPPYANSVLNIMKDTSLGAAIGYPELMQIFWSTVLFQTGQGIEVIVITLGTYLTISLIFAALINAYNRRYAIPGRF